MRRRRRIFTWSLIPSTTRITIRTEAFGYDTDQLQEHFLTCGMKEGRPGCADFNVAVYKEQNADLAAAYGDDLAAYYTHYMGCGHGEGRICH